jgi:hypothetical protein
MNLHKTYAALRTSNLVAGEAWYTRLLGRGPDYRPMDTLLHWELFDHGGLMLSTSDEIAGKGVIFFYVEDLAAERRGCRPWVSRSRKISRAIIRRWRRCVIPTAT